MNWLQMSMIGCCGLSDVTRQTEGLAHSKSAAASLSIVGVGAKKVPPPPVVLPKTLLVFWNKIFMLMPKLKK